MSLCLSAGFSRWNEHFRWIVQAITAEVGYQNICAVGATNYHSYTDTEAGTLANSLCCPMNVKVVTENESWVHDFEAENMSQWGFVTKDHQHWKKFNTAMSASKVKLSFVDVKGSEDSKLRTTSTTILAVSGIVELCESWEQNFEEFGAASMTMPGRAQVTEQLQISEHWLWHLGSHVMFPSSGLALSDFHLFP
jgi:hypothetical protein